jgi:Ser/Thr protein kinase RdoA (MazF antagonist)
LRTQALEDRASGTLLSSALCYMGSGGARGDDRRDIVLDEVLAAVTEQRHRAISLIQRFPEGEQGAYLVADPRGRRAVLKWRPGTERLDQVRFARAATRQLRQRRYPAPAYRVIGTALGGTYWMQTALLGRPLAHQTQRLPHLLPRLLALHELHVGQAPTQSPDVWPDEVVRTVLVGGEGYCRHEALREHSAATRTLLQTLQALVIRHRGALPMRQDIVHFDFQPMNVLVEGERISGVVDWDGARVGDAAFDLATLLYYTYEDDTQVRAELWTRGLAMTTPGAFAIYLAHLILRQADWSLRLHDAPTAARYIARGQAILHELSARLGDPPVMDAP